MIHLMFTRRIPLADRFWKYVTKTDDHWVWTGAADQLGYGRINISRRDGTILVHRLSWELTHGQIPSGMCVCHKCDFPPCVNPDHLFIGTHSENMRDMGRKNRSALGERHGQVKLADTDVAEIRRRIAAGPRGTAERLAIEFHVTQGHISDIKLGKTRIRTFPLSGHT